MVVSRGFKVNTLGKRLLLNGVRVVEDKFWVKCQQEKRVLWQSWSWLLLHWIFGQMWSKWYRTTMFLVKTTVIDLDKMEPFHSHSITRDLRGAPASIPELHGKNVFHNLPTAKVLDLFPKLVWPLFESRKADMLYRPFFLALLYHVPLSKFECSYFHRRNWTDSVILLSCSFFKTQRRTKIISKSGLWSQLQSNITTSF